MGRPDKRAAQQRRMREGVERALGRGRFAEAADALLILHADERAWALEPIARGLASEILRRPAPDPATTLAWLARVEREPRLLPSGPDGDRIRWVLFLAAYRARQWPRVRALFAALEPALAGSRWRACLEALVRGEESPDPDAFPSSLDADAARLGYDDALPRVSYPAPEHVEAVERTCLACFGSEPWARFRDVVLGWLGRAMPGDVARAVRRLAVQLSHRELVLRAREPRTGLEVARFCATQAVEAGAPPELERTVGVCFRVLAGILTGVVRDRTPVESAATILAAAEHYPSLTSMVDAIVLEPTYEGAAMEPANRLLRRLLEREVTIGRVAKAVAILRREEDEANERRETEMFHDAPPWLVSALEKLLDQPALLSATLCDLSQDAEMGGAVGLVPRLPIPVAARAIAVLWDATEREEIREALARFAEDLLDRMRQASDPEGRTVPLSVLRAMIASHDDHPLRGASDAELKSILRTPEGRRMSEYITGFGLAQVSLSPAMRALWEGVGERVLCHGAALLAPALEIAPSRKAEDALVARFWERRRTLLARVEALHEALTAGQLGVLDALERGLMDGLVVTQSDAARSLLHAEDLGAPRRLCRRIAELLHAAIERDGKAEVSPEMSHALRRAKGYLRKKPAAKKAVTKKAATKKAATKKATTSRATAQKTTEKATATKKATRKKPAADEASASPPPERAPRAAAKRAPNRRKAAPAAPSPQLDLDGIHHED